MNTNRFKFRVFLKKENRYAEETEYEELFWIGMDGRLYVDDGYDRPQFINYPDDKYKKGPNNIEDLIVEQCTGLRDANNKLIYEGDIICGKNPDCRHEIVYDNDGACFRAELLPKPEHWAQNALYSTPNQQWIDEFSKRVVGNIHENPELLKD